jgi:hypothetical protein
MNWIEITDPERIQYPCWASGMHQSVIWRTPLDRLNEPFRDEVTHFSPIEPPDPIDLAAEAYAEWFDMARREGYPPLVEAFRAGAKWQETRPS